MISIQLRNQQAPSNEQCISCCQPDFVSSINPDAQEQSVYSVKTQTGTQADGLICLVAECILLASTC